MKLALGPGVTMNRLLFGSMVSALAVSAAIVAGCEEERSCPGVGCGPSSHHLGSELWPPGDYEISIAYEAIEVDCSFRIGAASMSGDEDAGAFEDEPMADCSPTTAGPITVWVTDGVRLEMYDSPASFELSIERQGRALFDETIAPDYEISEISGPHCGVCRNTNETIDVGDLR
jgi:hypothetical protein